MKRETLHRAKIVGKKVMLALVADYDAETEVIDFFEKHLYILDPDGGRREHHGEKTCDAMHELWKSGKRNSACRMCPFAMAEDRGMIVACDELPEENCDAIDAGRTVVDAAIDAAFN